MVGVVDNHLLVWLMFNKAGRGMALCFLPHMPSATGLVINTWSVGFPSCCRVNYRGEQQPEETERVPDNYPHRLPPLSGRREHTQSNMGNHKGG